MALNLCNYTETPEPRPDLAPDIVDRILYVTDDPLSETLNDRAAIRLIYDKGLDPFITSDGKRAFLLRKGPFLSRHPYFDGETVLFGFTVYGKPNGKGNISSASSRFTISVKVDQYGRHVKIVGSPEMYFYIQAGLPENTGYKIQSIEVETDY